MRRIAILALAAITVLAGFGCSNDTAGDPGQSADNKMDQQNKGGTGDNATPKTEGM